MCILEEGIKSKNRSQKVNFPFLLTISRKRSTIYWERNIEILFSDEDMLQHAFGEYSIYSKKGNLLTSSNDGPSTTIRLVFRDREELSEHRKERRIRKKELLKEQKNPNGHIYLGQFPSAVKILYNIETQEMTISCDVGEFDENNNLLQ